MEILQVASSRASIFYKTQLQWHTGTYETRNIYLHKTYLSTHKTFRWHTAWFSHLEACRHTGLTARTHPALPASLTVLFLCWALSVRGKKLKNTLLTLVLGCHLTYTECISNSWEHLVSARSILRPHAHPGSHFRRLKECILPISDKVRQSSWTLRAFQHCAFELWRPESFRIRQEPVLQFLSPVWNFRKWMTSLNLLV